jgi:hypothetical protein
MIDIKCPPLLHHQRLDERKRIARAAKRRPPQPDLAVCYTRFPLKLDNKVVFENSGRFQGEIFIEIWAGSGGVFERRGWLTDDYS